MELIPIAYARNGHTDKFGIPRQSRDDSPILTRIVFEPDYSVGEALRGIEGYSHLWLIWGFSEVIDASQAAGAEGLQAKPAERPSWSPTVRPPRLGGNKRMGVFATRSPFRPNPLGLTSVRNLTPNLSFGEGACIGESGRLELLVSGADLLDGTPIYDIKPYLSFSDSHPDALNGFAEETKDYRLTVEFLNSIKPARNLHLTSINPAPEVLRDIEYILSQDPRPAYQDDPEREYKMDYAGYRVTFVVAGETVVVKRMEKT